MALAPLPNLPAVPSGREIRVVSTDLLSIYAVWQVEGEDLVSKSFKTIGQNKSVKVLFKIGKQLKPPYQGVTGKNGDVWLQIGDERVSLNELLIRTYHLNLPGGKVLPGKDSSEGK